MKLHKATILGKNNQNLYIMYTNMKKILNPLGSKLVWLFMLFLAFQVTFVACNDDDDTGGMPEITGVRSCDPTTADSLFSKASQGQVIAIIGKNLGHCQKVYINDQQVSFSTTMNTDHSVIVTVPSETDGFVLTAFDSSLKDEIRVETRGGVATYAFKVLSASPSISRIQCTYPRETGDTLNIYGTNLISIERIYFTDLTKAELDTTTWTEIGGNQVEVETFNDVVQEHYLDKKTGSYVTTSQLQAVIPALPYDAGCLVLECSAGTQYIAYSKTPGVPVINSLSSDMPVIGETLTLTGTEFVQVESIQIGDVVYTTDEFTVAETEAEITIPITKVPSADSEGGLILTTPGGIATVDEVFQYSTLLNDFEYSAESPMVINMGWSPDIEYLTDVTYGGTGSIGHFNTYGQWWGQMCFFRRDWNNSPFTLPDYDVIPADATADHLYLAFEVYDNNSSYNNGGDGFQGILRWSLWTGTNNNGESPDMLYTNFAWDDYDAQTFVYPDGPMLQDINGEAHVGQWYRAVIPLSYFVLTDADGNDTTTHPWATSTYQDIKETGINIIRIMSYTQGTKSGTVDVYLDNVRLIYIQ